MEQAGNELDPAVAAMLDKQAINSAIQSYCRASDRRDFEVMRSAYHDDAFDDHGLYKGPIDGLIDWVKVYHRNTYQSMHLIGPPLIELEGDVAFAETYCHLLQHMRSVENGETNHERIVIYCRYVDRFERRANLWKIAHRIVAYESVYRDVLAADCPPLVPATHTPATRDRNDPVYSIRETGRV